MASRVNYVPPEKSVTQLLAELKEELKDFAATRVAMLRAEMSEKFASMTSVLPAIAAGAALIVLSAFTLVLALVCVLAMALGGNAGAFAASFAIVGSVFLLGGAGAVWYGISRLKARNLKPERTLRVLRQDQTWFQNEARKIR